MTSFRRFSAARIVAALLAMSLMACSSLEVHSDHDPHADFSKYKTYAWAQVLPGQEAPDISGVPSDLIERRIRAAVDSQLASKGLQLASGGQNPDLFVRDHVVHQEKVEVTDSGASIGYGYGPWFGYSAPAFSTRQYTEGTLVLDFIDSKTNRLVWRGIAKDTAEAPEKSADKIQKVVAATLEKYPPLDDQKRGLANRAVSLG